MIIRSHFTCLFTLRWFHYGTWLFSRVFVLGLEREWYVSRRWSRWKMVQSCTEICASWCCVGHPKTVHTPRDRWMWKRWNALTTRQAVRVAICYLLRDVVLRIPVPRHSIAAGLVCVWVRTRVSVVKVRVTPRWIAEVRRIRVVHFQLKARTLSISLQIPNCFFCRQTPLNRSLLVGICHQQKRHKYRRYLWCFKLIHHPVHQRAVFFIRRDWVSVPSHNLRYSSLEFPGTLLCGFRPRKLFFLNSSLLGLETRVWRCFWRSPLFYRNLKCLLTLLIA